MSQPVQNLRNCRHLDPLRHFRSVDHQNRQTQRPRRIQLGTRTAAAGVFRDHQLRAMTLQQGAVVSFGKRPARHDDLCVRQGHCVGLIHKPQQVMVLGLDCEVLNMHPANCQEYPLRRASQRLNRCSDIRHMPPRIARLSGPGRSRQRRQRNLRFATRFNRISAHLGCKRMGGVYYMGDVILTNVSGQTFGSTKTAHPYWQWLRARFVDATGIRVNRRNPLFGNGFGQGVGLCRAAEDQEVWHA